jgi:hypothetical protein
VNIATLVCILSVDTLQFMASLRDEFVWVKMMWTYVAAELNTPVLNHAKHCCQQNLLH